MLENLPAVHYLKWDKQWYFSCRVKKFLVCLSRTILFVASIQYNKQIVEKRLRNFPLSMLNGQGFSPNYTLIHTVYSLKPVSGKTDNGCLYTASKNSHLNVHCLKVQLCFETTPSAWRSRIVSLTFPFQCRVVNFLNISKWVVFLTECFRVLYHVTWISFLTHETGGGTLGKIA